MVYWGSKRLDYGRKFEVFVYVGLNVQLIVRDDQAERSLVGL
jgi:hypothetical protein